MIETLPRFFIPAATAILALARVLTGAWHLVLGWGLSFGLLQPDRANAIHTALVEMSLGHRLAWTGYAVAYVATAFLALRRDRRVIWAAGIAVVLDFGYWAAIVILPAYHSAYTPTFSIGDLVINLTSLLVLCGAFLIARHTPSR